MSYTKSDLVKGALVELGISDYAFDLSTDQLDQALARLDAMMAEWNGRKIRLGYPISARPKDVDANTDSGIPDSAYEAVITNLAMRLAPSYGKTVSTETRIAATRSMNTVFAISARPKERQLANTLAGAGAKNPRSFLTPDGSMLPIEAPDQSADFD